MTDAPVLFVTGGSRGIGAAVARMAAARGYAVGLNYLSDGENAERVASAIAHSGGRALALQGDVASEPDVIGMFETVNRELGLVSALVNNAGITGGVTRLDGVTLDQIERTFAINVTGAFLCAREAVKRMSTAHGGKGGAIVNLSSGASRLGSPGRYIHYAATKGAIDTMTIGLAREVAAEGIRVNAVRAGVTDTDMHAFAANPDLKERVSETIPMRRVASAEEIAESVMWLLSDKASYMTGALVDAAGGL